jgi:hypothetical protein
MKIAIIGGGWVGCHLALKLKDTHKVTIFEKHKELFTETSYNNQNRLHLGFHYPRSAKTRNLCLDTFERFINDYGFITKDVDKNLYCVPQNESFIDYPTFKQIFKDYNIEDHPHSLKNIEGCVNTNERHINFKKINKFFNEKLSDIVVEDNITDKKLDRLQKEYDLVINCTNNHIKDKNCDNSFYETTLTLIYKKISSIDFDGLTLVDGDLFSIYPYDKERFTLTDVEYTPLKKFKTVKKLKSYNKKITSSLVHERKKLIEKKVLKYYPDFLNHFKYDTYFISTKTKTNNTSDDRSPIITKENNLINCFTGKIQGIYLIEDYLRKELSL